jgi:hypothetical protein
VQLTGIVKLLEQANENIGKRIVGMNVSDLTEVLTECQQKAIYIGNAIEETEGEDTVTVKMLEEYCELIYQLNESMQDVQKVTDIIKRISDLLPRIRTSIDFDLPDSKKEIVFLPYKASMWDSFESVWSAAVEDDTCNVYVIPFPYYDKNKDGSFAGMHYETEGYPDYVPLTSWQEYQIAERHPDIIYIHNPYDGYNFVTSVHPDFYSKNLKKYTDMLVYIPYFVCPEDVPKHLCVVSGTLYADKVVVQSEKIRKTYIEEFHRMEKENNCEGVFGKAEDKFVSLGSPKYDKVRNTRLEDVTVPDEWNRLIIKTDGNRKKVVLYNTTIAVLLEQKDRMLDKISFVLKTMKENEQIVLLWRPHPLFDTTIASMRPELSDRYKDIVSKYRLEGWGIYDDSADLNRAIAVSDAYYGDWGSMVALYEKTGKPIMIQNLEMINNEEITDDTM